MDTCKLMAVVDVLENGPRDNLTLLVDANYSRREVSCHHLFKNAQEACSAIGQLYSYHATDSSPFFPLPLAYKLSRSPPLRDFT